MSVAIVIVSGLVAFPIGWGIAAAIEHVPGPRVVWPKSNPAPAQLVRGRFQSTLVGLQLGYRFAPVRLRWAFVTEVMADTLTPVQIATAWEELLVTHGKA